MAVAVAAYKKGIAKVVEDVGTPTNCVEHSQPVLLGCLGEAEALPAYLRDF